MTPQEKMLYHQIHPAKLVTDVSTSILSTYFLWVGNIAGFWAVFLIPSIIVTLLLFRFADLEKLKASKFGHYVAGFMSRKIESIRFSGQIIMWMSAAYHWPLGIASGVLIIVGAWLSGLLKKGYL